MRKTDLFNNSSIKTDPSIFNLYQSGNRSTQKSIIVKFIAILGFGLIVAIFLFYNLLDGFADDSKQLNKNLQELEQPQKKNTNRNANNKKQNSNDDTSINDKYFNMQITFNNIDGYEIFNHIYKKQYFRIFTKNTKSKIIYKITILKLPNYEIQKLILRTSKSDLQKYFLIPQTNTTNKIKRVNNDNTKNIKR